jgi:hypothetical protein
MSIVESTIEYYIRQFVQQMDIQCSENEYALFMKTVHEKRTLKLSSDTFCLVCSYLHGPTMISFATCSKLNMTNYKNIWGLFQNHYPYTNSTINPKDFLSIRNAIGMDQYYMWGNHGNLYSSLDEIEIKQIKKSEDYIENLYKKVKKLTPICYQYKITKLKHIGEIKDCVKDRDLIYENLSTPIKKFLKDHQFTSISTPYCKYYTIKHIPDTRLYGYNNECENGKILTKWLTGEYNTYPDYDFDYDNVDDLMDEKNNEYEYEVDGRHTRDMYRTRIKPRFVGIALDGWCQCTCYRCCGDCKESHNCNFKY